MSRGRRHSEAGSSCRTNRYSDGRSGTSREYIPPPGDCWSDRRTPLETASGIASREIGLARSPPASGLDAADPFLDERLHRIGRKALIRLDLQHSGETVRWPAPRRYPESWPARHRADWREPDQWGMRSPRLAAAAHPRPAVSRSRVSYNRSSAAMIRSASSRPCAVSESVTNLRSSGSTCRCTSPCATSRSTSRLGLAVVSQTRGRSRRGGGRRASVRHQPERPRPPPRLPSGCGRS